MTDTAITAAQQVALVAQYSAISERQMDQVLSAMAQAWAAVPSYHDSDMQAWVDQVVPLVQTANQNLAYLTNAYVAMLASLASGQSVTPADLPAGQFTTDAMRGVSATEVYGRVPNEVWWQMSQGNSIDESRRIGGERAADIAATDMQLARTHSAQYAMTQYEGITGYVRVPDMGACAFCSLTSTRVYKTADLMPIHPHCRCTVQPVFNGNAPETVAPEITDETDHAGEQPTVVMHGEIGPLLTNRAA